MADRPPGSDERQGGISPDLVQLSEHLARRAHETWARLRTEQGWRLGTGRNDERREHPALVVFDELSEEEKNYDRQMVLGTLRELLALGYEIEPQRGVAQAAANEVRRDAVGPRSELRELLQAGRAGNVALQKLWRERSGKGWEATPETYALLAARMVEVGEPLFGYDVAEEGVRQFPGNVRLRQLLALALTRSGAAGAANALLSQLYRDGHRDEETIGLLARTHRDLATEENDREVAEGRLEKARSLYQLAYRKNHGYWTGINAATLAQLLGKREEAKGLAAEVAEQCRNKLLEGSEAAKKDRYWILSTLGETALLQGQANEAEEWYLQAAELARGDWGNLRSTRHNARLLNASLGGDPEFVERVFRFPTVAVFAGHRVDEANRAAERFPAHIVDRVKEEICRRLERLNVTFGYASAANGSDILFLEAMLERNGEIHIVLPYEREHFLKDSVESTSGGEWAKRYEQVLSRAVEVLEASKHSQMCGKLSYEFAGLMLQGLAKVHAQQLETKLVSLAVWDGRPGDGPDGTAGTVERWTGAGLEVEVIEPRGMLGGLVPEVAANVEPSAGGGEGSRETPAEFSSEIRALLFADAEGFSKLSDEEVPRFVEHFLGLTATLIAETAHQPLTKNTWGDGLYFVFPGVEEAGLFALELRDRVGATDWAKKGLPNLRLRIGLHAGPVYGCTDPVTLRRNYIGAHVSRAARIEPVTPAGQVYGSQAFAALAAARGVRGFICTYVGQTAMAKLYGSLPTYVVLRRNTAGDGGEV